MKAGENYNIVVGKGGPGGAGGKYQTGRLPSGSNGGNSSFGELISQGGAGGQGCLMSSSGTQISNGASGTDYNGNSGNAANGGYGGVGNNTNGGNHNGRNRRKRIYIH